MGIIYKNGMAAYSPSCHAEHSEASIALNTLGTQHNSQ